MARSGLRDLVVLFGTFALLLGGLYLYAGVWPPAVIVESGSMMHADSEVGYGRLGTIDPGDLVLVKKADGVDDITTLVEGGRDRYGKPGDVIVYYPAGDRGATPIIHRAVAYVELDAGSFFVRWSDEGDCEGGAEKVARNGRSWCRYGAEGISIPSVPVKGPGASSAYKPSASGFLTKGDNPVTNRGIDQYTLPGVTRPVPMEWIEGKARAELPWIGLLKLALAGKANQADPPPAWTKIGWAYAPLDLWVMLGLTLFVLVGGPLLVDAYRAIRARREQR